MWFWKGCEKAGFTYHCYSCNYVENSTANTFFYKVKFGSQKAFLVIFEITTKSLFSIQVGKRYEISQIKAWFFCRK